MVLGASAVLALGLLGWWRNRRRYRRRYRRRNRAGRLVMGGSA
jgi:hypothetical protein